MAKKKKKTPEPEQQAARRRRQDRFLAAFGERGTLSAAAEAAGVSRRRHYQWMELDPTYPERFVEAQEIANENLEKEARRRAVEGWTEPIFYEGMHVGDKPKYSDRLLEFLMKGNLPEKYKERYENVGEPERHVNYNIDLTQLSDEELRTLDKMADKIGGAHE